MKNNLVKEEILKQIDTVLDDYKNIENKFTSNVSRIPFIEVDKLSLARMMSRSP